MSEHIHIEAEFHVGQRVHVTAVTSKNFTGEIIDRFLDEDGTTWRYSLDKRNYLTASMLEAVE